MSYIHSFKHFIGAKGDRLDIVLFGGAMGSLFSLLQFMVSPYIGQLSDRYGRKRTLLWTMVRWELEILVFINELDGFIRQGMCYLLFCGSFLDNFISLCWRVSLLD